MYDVYADKDLELELSYNYIRGEEQHVTILANEYMIADYVAKGPENKVFTIPKSEIGNGVLLIEINLPDAKKPESKDKRETALWIKRIVVREAESK